MILQESQIPDLIVKTDAFLLGWGAASEGVHTGSLWSVEEWAQHINYTELTAGALVVRTFAKHKMECQCTLRIDNKIEIFLDARF